MTHPVVETKYGRVQGLEEDGLRVFRGVPFARPPVGGLRFRPPRPPDPWAGVRPAERFGPIAPQPPSLRPLLPGEPVEWAEDCLSLNVWTPALDAGRRPVLVWVHGGSFVTGSGASVLYRGHHLCARGDVMVVTVNYRLGALGFLAHPGLRDEETGAAGNWGLLDQLAALEWVRDHAGALGGDPDNVTVFGESAGAMCVSTLLGTPAAEGLFRRAIAQSGGSVATPLELAAETGERLLAELGLAGEPVTRLRDVPVEAIVEAQTRLLVTDAWDRIPLATVVDEGVLPGSPLGAVARGLASGVSLLVGTNRDEMKFFAIGDPSLRNLDEAGLRARLRRTLGPEADAAVEAYRAARGARGQPVSAPELWCAIQTDWVFRVPAVRVAEAQRAHSDQTYAYLFTWESPAAGGALGACHGLEIPFVFGTLTSPGVGMFTGEGPQARALSERMQDAWLAFARSGDPSTTELGEWPAYDARRRATMVLGPACSVQEAPLEEERRFWESRV